MRPGSGTSRARCIPCTATTSGAWADRQSRLSSASAVTQARSRTTSPPRARAPSCACWTASRNWNAPLMQEAPIIGNKLGFIETYAKTYAGPPNEKDPRALPGPGVMKSREEALATGPACNCPALAKLGRCWVAASAWPGLDQGLALGSFTAGGADPLHDPFGQGLRRGVGRQVTGRLAAADQRHRGRRDRRGRSGRRR